MAKDMNILSRNSTPPESGRHAVTEMIALQRRIFEKQRRIIEAREAHLSPGFHKYRNEYRKAVSGFVSPSGFGALCDAIAASRTAYVADYHTLRLSQRTFVKLIRGIMPQVDHICLCLELVPIRHQDTLDRFLEGRISEKTFLKRIEYRKHWPYDIWPHFKPIFDLAAEQGFVIIALDSNPSLSLKKRDQLAAEQIAAAARRFPDALLLSLTGQMHTAPSHLPAAVDRAFVKAGMPVPERVIVYQNAEEIYWQLAEERKEGLEVVRVDDQSFCVNNTPPLVQQLSYLHWVQADSETMEFDEAEGTVRSLIQTLGTFLNLPWAEAARTVRVLIPGDLDLMSVVEEGNLTAFEKQQLLLSVKARQSVCIAKLSAVYLAGLSLNHAAEESAHFLKHTVSRGTVPKELRDRFYYFTLNEACGFLGSKIINPKRKTDHEGKLRKIAAAFRVENSRGTAEARGALFALEHIALETRGRPLSTKAATLLRDPAVFHAASHILGYILGDRLYYALTGGTVSKKHIKKLFAHPLDGPRVAQEEYFRIAERVRSVEMPRRI